ncbi:hypothetical protein GCM10007928_44700 [Sulfitobacter porphyrae]|nr:hypothetical protein GCM10007928_44700 [Sulfitobacter porphyrae]
MFSVVTQLEALQRQIDHLEEEFLAWQKAEETSRCLAMMTGIGPIAASAIAKTVPDSGQFRSGR